jgi:hypothetical protein
MNSSAELVTPKANELLIAALSGAISMPPFGTRGSAAPGSVAPTVASVCIACHAIIEPGTTMASRPPTMAHAYVAAGHRIRQHRASLTLAHRHTRSRRIGTISAGIVGGGTRPLF